jgi:hypothetical protein
MLEYLLYVGINYFRQFCVCREMFLSALIGQTKYKKIMLSAPPPGPPRPALPYHLTRSPMPCLIGQQQHNTHDMIADNQNDNNGGDQKLVVDGQGQDRA